MDKLLENSFFCIRCEKIYHQTIEGKIIYISDHKLSRNNCETRICDSCKQKIGIANLKEILIVCMYCKKCYGIFSNGQKKYFSPVQIEKYSGLKSHGICHNCCKEFEIKECE